MFTCSFGSLSLSSPFSVFIVSSNYLSTWAVPYVASFDDQLILGLKDPKDVTEKYFFSHLQNQQLVAK